MKVMEIDTGLEELNQRRARFDAARRFATPDRVPVLPALAHRFLVPKIGASFREYYSDPVKMLSVQIHAQEWILEHVRTDAHCIVGPWVGCWTDFQNTFEAGSLGCKVEFPENDIPWVSSHWVTNDDDVDKLIQIDYLNVGINRRQQEYRLRMIEAADDFPVKFRDGPVFHPGANPSLTHTCDGAFGIAGDLMGQTELFGACYERPEFVSRLLGVITDKVIEYLDFCRRLEGLPHGDLSWTDDLAVSLSPGMYRDLVLPHEKRLRFHFDGRASFHMCGRTDHLLEVFADELRIDEFQGFGWQVDLDRVTEVLAGRVVLLGNVNPLTIYSGTPDEVMQETRRVMERLGPFRGLIIQDGNNIPPGSPVSNINAMMEAAERYGRYD